ncbi:MAG TPA: alpha-L-fucosidase, partial [Terriglobales bacterium]|nr:alpha-L-fucosidase [Terriglobales bacterium]
MAMSATRDSYRGFSAQLKLPRNIIALLLFLILQVFLSMTVRAAQPPDNLPGYQPSPENLKARQDFQDMKFGMFIHWGVYSVLGDGEWVFHNRKLKLDEYERLPKFFDPEKFDAKTWVALAKAAGMKY